MTERSSIRVFIWALIIDVHGPNKYGSQHNHPAYWLIFVVFLVFFVCCCCCCCCCFGGGGWGVGGWTEPLDVGLPCSFNYLGWSKMYFVCNNTTLTTEQLGHATSKNYLYNYGPKLTKMTSQTSTLPTTVILRRMKTLPSILMDSWVLWDFRRIVMTVKKPRGV